MQEEMREQRTKCQLNEALKALLREKPMEQIRVRELTERCGLRRQSFYYHFADIYELLDWSCQQERQDLLGRLEEFLTWQQALRELLRCIEADRPYYLAVRDWRGRQGLEQVFGEAIDAVMSATASYYQKRRGGGEDAESGRQQLSCERDVLISLLESWIINEPAYHAGVLIAMIEGMMEKTLAGAAYQSMTEWVEE